MLQILQQVPPLPMGQAAMVLKGVRIGANAWLAPGCALVQKIAVGDDAFIGIGAVVTRGVPAGARVFGNPARPLPSLGARAGQPRGRFAGGRSRGVRLRSGRASPGRPPAAS
jgi:hypothetical protein